MGKSSALRYNISKQQNPPSLRVFFFLPISLAFTTFLLIFIYQNTTSDILTDPHDTIFLEPDPNSSNDHVLFSLDNTAEDLFFDLPRTASYAKQLKWSLQDLFGSTGENINNTEVYHDFDMFMKEYKEMNKSFKIYAYPHSKDHPFANVLLPTDFDPKDFKAHHASELYFKKALLNSHFITKNPGEADLFYMPFSIAGMRFDPRIGPEGMQDFIRDYIHNVSQKYPYWNRTVGADHFYVACHWIEKIALDIAVQAKLNAIQVVCSSTYFFRGYFPHKDFSMPQIWPKEGDPPNLESSKRKQLAFFSGSLNSPAKAALRKYWRNDTEIFTSFHRSQTDNGEQLLKSKFCLHVKGYEVNTVRVMDAIHYGCVPVILANQYDLPFTDILNWKSFSVVVHYIDIPVLKKILQGISLEDFAWLQSNVLKVRKHFKWDVPPVDYDAFNMAMFELWLRRSSVRISPAAASMESA